jgi:uncharacterized protein
MVKKKALENPFVLSGYFGEAYFCDRKEELAILQENFTQGRNTVLYSWRRLGKTSLIQYFLQTLEEAKLADTIYVDLMATRDMGDAIIQITQAVYEKYGKTSGGFSEAFRKLIGSLGLEVSFDPFTGMPVFSVGMSPSNQPGAPSLQAIGQFLTSRKKNVIIALDEFQQVSSYPDNKGEAVFRGWMQSFPEIRLVFSGSHRHMMEAMFVEQNRPFYRSAELLRLKPIPLPEYKSFITSHYKKAGKTIPEALIEHIYILSRGQTYAVQLLCNKLFSKKEPLDEQMLYTVQQDIIAQESHFFTQYSKLLTDAQWQVLQAIAREEPVKSVLSKDFNKRNRLAANSTVATALKALIQKEIIIEDEGFWVHDVMLSWWLKSVKPRP